MRAMALQRGDCRAVKERRVLDQSLCTALAQSMVLIPGLGRDRIWGLDTGSGCGLGPGRCDGLDIGWDWAQALDMGEDPDRNWGLDLLHDTSECLGLDCSWGCWTGTGTGNKSPFHS